jgi:hypothetical protein
MMVFDYLRRVKLRSEPRRDASSRGMPSRWRSLDLEEWIDVYKVTGIDLIHLLRLENAPDAVDRLITSVLEETRLQGETVGLTEWDGVANQAE